jgi:hypothetical protein
MKFLAARRTAVIVRKPLLAAPRCGGAGGSGKSS